MSSHSDINCVPQDEGKPGYLIFEKIMIVAIICFILVALLVFSLHVYAVWFSEWPASFSGRTRRRSASTAPRFSFTGEEPARLLNVGLDSAILETLPMFVYKSQNFTDRLDCAVCLCEFQENEKTRFLPNCRHSFHVECIDMWFRSHSTCPLCRTSAQPEQPALESIGVEQEVSATIPGSISSGTHDILNSEQRQTVSSGEEYNLSNPTNIFSWECGEKQINRGIDNGTSGGGRELRMPHIAIEIPKRTNGHWQSGEGHQALHSPTSSQSSSKSPVTRLRSLSKMFNRDRETKVFPCDYPAECDAENNEI